MIYKIQTANNSKLEKFYENSMAELDSFFKLNWKRNRPNLILIPNRKTINSLAGKETENWVVGWAEKTKIYLLSDENYEKESCHKYSDEEYFALIKHELAHCFSDVISVKIIKHSVFDNLQNETARNFYTTINSSLKFSLQKNTLLID